MQKYRRFTDQSTGINPFIIADQKKHNLIYNIITILKSIIFTQIFLLCLPLILLGNVIRFLSFFNRIILFLCGMILNFDDNKFVNNLNKVKKNKIILSNYGSIIDVFYYLYRYNIFYKKNIFRIPGVRFLVIHENQQSEISFGTEKGLGCLIKVFTKRQPFYVNKSNSSEKSLKKIIQSDKISPLVIFYQGIRTNGLGTIKFSRSLSQIFFQLQSSYIISKISITPRDQLFHNLVRSPIFNIFRAFGSTSRLTLKIRSQITQFSTNIHNVNDIKKDVDQFMMTNGSKLLQKNAKDYESFIEFYEKTQKSNYVHGE